MLAGKETVLFRKRNPADFALRLPLRIQPREKIEPIDNHLLPGGKLDDFPDIVGVRPRIDHHFCG